MLVLWQWDNKDQAHTGTSYGVPQAINSGLIRKFFPNYTNVYVTFQRVRCRCMDPSCNCEWGRERAGMIWDGSSRWRPLEYLAHPLGCRQGGVVGRYYLQTATYGRHTWIESVQWIDYNIHHPPCSSCRRRSRLPIGCKVRIGLCLY